MFGLFPRDIDCIIAVFEQYSSLEKVVVFGSRAMGNQKAASDIDLALFGKLDLSEVNAIAFQLEEDCAVPFFFDVIHYDTLVNDKLKAHIDTYGKMMYER